jgi:alpha-methylacyl-CoA racemase
MPGPLDGVRVLELAGIGPAPFACMLLSQLGADVLRVDRPGGSRTGNPDLLADGRPTLTLDLKNADDVATVLELVERADVLIEGFRPGVAERLGVGPDKCLAANPRLIYARMTGWGQEGPLADKVGHDINYAGIVGALGAIGEPGRKPVPPLNLVADFGGGAMFCVTGVLAALVERTTSGKGQVVDVAMVDGVASLMTMFWSMHANGGWSDDRGSNLLDGGAPFYDTYECADGEYVAVGAIEEQFWTQVVDGLGIQDAPPRGDTFRWPELRKRMQEVFLTKTRDEWATLFADRPACVTPVLRLSEAPRDPHVHARAAMVEHDGVTRPNVAPRFSRTPGDLPPAAGRAGALAGWGLDQSSTDGSARSSRRAMASNNPGNGLSTK